MANDVVTDKVSETLLEYRVGRLEAAFERVESKLSAMDEKLSHMDAKLSHIDGRLLNLPTSWQLVTVFATQFLGMIGAIIAITKLH